LQAKLAQLPEAEGGLGKEYLLGVVAERMAREGGGMGAVEGGGGGGGAGSQLKPRRMQQVCSNGEAIGFNGYTDF
jgi:hypothetical protein